MCMCVWHTQVADAFAALRDERWAVIDALCGIEEIHGKVKIVATGLESAF